MARDERAPTLEYEAMIPRQRSGDWSWSLWLMFKQFFFAVSLAILVYNAGRVFSQYSNDAATGMGVGAFMIGLCVPLGGGR